LFPEADVRHLVSSRSDHCPILIELEKAKFYTNGPKTVRYEMMWERDLSLTDEINLAWEKHDQATNL
jgi:hypothetical protein